MIKILGRILIVLLVGLLLLVAGGLFYFDFFLNKPQEVPVQLKPIVPENIEDEVVEVDVKMDDLTDLYILGTRHRKRPEFNGDSILKVLMRINPDLILCELDSSFFDSDFRLKSPSWKFKLGVAYGFMDFENEGIALRHYREMKPSVILRPFDIEGRNQFYKKHDISTKSSKVLKKIRALYEKNELSSANSEIWEGWLKSNRLYNEAYENQSTPKELNSKRHQAICAERQLYKYRKINEIVQSEEALKKHRDFYQLHSDFWDTRNLKMVENIRKFVKEFGVQRVVVLTGATHPYYLLRELEKVEEQDFELREVF